MQDRSEVSDKAGARQSSPYRRVFAVLLILECGDIYNSDISIKNAMICVMSLPMSVDANSCHDANVKMLGGLWRRQRSRAALTVAIPKHVHLEHGTIGRPLIGLYLGVRQSVTLLVTPCQSVLQ